MCLAKIASQIPKQMKCHKVELKEELTSLIGNNFQSIECGQYFVVLFPTQRFDESNRLITP